jgi:hypothetical protein
MVVVVAESITVCIYTEYYVLLGHHAQYVLSQSPAAVTMHVWIGTNRTTNASLRLMVSSGPGKTAAIEFVVNILLG